MMRTFLFFNLLFLSLSFSSCSKSIYPTQADYSAVVKVDNEVQKYNMQFDFMSTHLNAILVVRKMESGEIRMVGASPFGLSLFDFGLNESGMIVYSCIEPLRKKRLLKILEDDFSTIFLSNKMVKKVKQQKDHIQYVNNGGIARSVVRVYNQNDSTNVAQNIKISHSWMRLFIQLEKMEEANATE